MKGLSDLVDRIRAAGDTTANYIADKTDSRTLDRWTATGRLQRILLVVAVLLALAGLSLLAGCAAPAKRMEMACVEGTVGVISSGQVFVTMIPCGVVGSYEE